MELTAKGTVDSIIYRNEENGYTVLNLDCTDGGQLTCVGIFPTLSVGTVLTVSGTVSMHNKYGEQLKVTDYKVCDPTTKVGIIRYLASGLIKGVGQTTAEHIYDMFGDDTFGVIENNPSALAKVRGISDKKALDIANSVAELKRMQQQVMFLQGYGISTKLSVKIYNLYGEATKDLVSANPYRLIADIDGVGFLTADKIAQSMGIEPLSSFRVSAGIVYVLKDSADRQGNTYLQLDDVVSACTELLGTDMSAQSALVEKTLTELSLDRKIITFEVKGSRCIALERYYMLEKNVATMLVQLNHDAKRLLIDAESLIKQFETVNKITFHQSQLDAVRSAIVNGVTVITGGPGTGKTTIIKCVADVLKSKGLRVEFCAPTGRAAKRMSQSTGYDAKTIHRLLGFEPHADGRSLFKYNRNNHLPCDVVIVDELSMVDVSIMYSLLCALENGTRVILVGDKDQLPSVGAGNVLADIIRSGVIEIKYLTFIYRQSQDSLIVTNAHLINNGKMPEINNQSKDFFVMSMTSAEQTAETVVQLVTTRLPKFTGLTSSDIQVLGALKNGVAGVENLNNLLQNALNPRKSGQELTVGKTVIRVGDRVMQTVNNYNLPYTRYLSDGTVEEGEGVFNGDIGFVRSIDRANGIMQVMYDDNRLANYGMEDLGDIQLAYAITIHKSQGSEFDVVVVPLVSGPPTIINKNLLYTAITRAKRAVVLVGNRKVLALMVHNNYIATRTTNLCRFLKRENKVHKIFFEGDKPDSDGDNFGDFDED